MIKAEKQMAQITGMSSEIVQEFFHIGRAIHKLPADKRDEMVVAFTLGAMSEDPEEEKKRPDFDELIHSNEES